MRSLNLRAIASPLASNRHGCRAWRPGSRGASLASKSVLENKSDTASPPGTHQTTAHEREEINSRIMSTRATNNARFEAVVAHNNLLTSKLSNIENAWQTMTSKERTLFEAKLAQNKQDTQKDVLRDVQKLVDSVADTATEGNAARCEKCEKDIARLNDQLALAQDSLRRIEETHIPKQKSSATSTLRSNYESKKQRPLWTSDSTNTHNTSGMQLAFPLFACRRVGRVYFGEKSDSA